MKSRLTSTAGLHAVLGSLFPSPPRLVALLVVSWLHHTAGGGFSSALFVLSAETRELTGHFRAAPERQRHFPFTTGAALTLAANPPRCVFRRLIDRIMVPVEMCTPCFFLRQQRRPYAAPPRDPVSLLDIKSPPALHISFIRLIIYTERTPFDMFFPIKGPLFSSRELRQNMQMSPLCF